MSSALSRTAFTAAAVVAAALAGSALAQPNFSPPIDAPTPLSAPISFELAPGAAADCVGSQSVEGAPLPVPPETRMRLVVEQAPGGVRLRIIDQTGGDIEIALVVSDDGAITLDESTDLGAASDVERETLAAVAGLVPELRLHRRTLDQDDPLYDANEIERVFGDMFAAMAGQGVSPDISGGAFLSGESSLDGARVAVFKTNVTIEDQSVGMRVVIDAVEAYDVATGLRAYAATTMRIPSPPGLDVPEIVLRQSLLCTLSRS